MHVARKQKKLERARLMWTVVQVRFKSTERTVSSKAETNLTFYLTWTDLNNNLRNAYCYLILQIIETHENSCFSSAAIIGTQTKGYNFCQQNVFLWTFTKCVISGVMTHLHNISNVRKVRMLWNVESDKNRYRNARDEGMKKNYLRNSTLES
jgi:hypothetical protein